MHNIWFSDIYRHNESLKVDISIGSDSLWNFQESEIRRGGPNEPVAVKTTLGWVLSGPLTGMTLNSIENIDVNFLPSFLSKSDKIEETVQNSWDLETIGIRPENEVHEHVIDNIIFTGKIYSVGLPWKAGHRALSTNYENSLIRLKGLGKKLRKDPPTLAKYNGIINEQATSFFFFFFFLSYKNKFLKRKIKIHFLVNTRSEERHGVTESSLQVPLTISFFIYKVQSRYSC